MSKIIDFFNNHTLIDFVRKSLYILGLRLNIKILIRKIKAFYYFKKFNVTLGKNVSVYGQIFNIKLGNDVNFYPNTIFEFSNNAIFRIGDNSLLSYGVIISCRQYIEIGADVQIGEYTSIRDSTHTYADASMSIKNSIDESNKISIGNDIWIGRGCIILPGTIIEDRVIVGANSVVKGHLISNWMYAGSPARAIKQLE